MSATIKVHAAPGKNVPFHRATKASPGAGLFVLPSGSDEDVPNDQYVRRRIAAGDLHTGPAGSCNHCKTTASKE